MVGWTNGWKFDVSNRAHQRSFKDFIEFVRSRLGVDGTVMQHARRLPPQRVIPVFQDLELSAGQNTVVTLRLRTDNLYVVGFRNTGDQWFEFRGEGGGHTIHGSTMLRFSGGYVGRGLGTLGSVTDINIESSATIEDAVRGLAGYRGEVGISEDRLKVWLRTLILSFIESSRFTGMADCVAAALSGSEQEKKDTRFTTSLVEQIHNWSSLSKALLDAANDVSIQDRIHFAAFVIMARTNRSWPAARQHRSANADYDDVAFGLTLVDVLSVVINNIDNENPGDFYGTVRVDDKVFHRERSN